MNMVEPTLYVVYQIYSDGYRFPIAIFLTDWDARTFIQNLSAPYDPCDYAVEEKRVDLTLSEMVGR